MSDVIGEGKVVSIHFILDVDGQNLNTTQDDAPVVYLQGTGGMVPGLQAALAGKSVGDHVVVSVPPSEGYGERTDASPQRVPRNAFPPDFPAQPGIEVGGEDDHGNVHSYWIVHVEDDHLILDPNHPLAGATLEFDVRIVGVRDATASELEQGHPQGAGGVFH